MKLAVTIENLSKRYNLRQNSNGQASLSDDLMALLRAPLAARRARHGTSDDEMLWALKNVSLDIEQGETVGLIGRNGAGKSTLLKILARVTRPTSGTVNLYGRVGSLLEVGTGFHPDLTGRENIFLNGVLLGMTRSEISRKFDEIVCFAGNEKFLEVPVKHYSSGMYLRLAFAVAVHLDLEILLLDEVLAVGDAAFQEKCLQKINEMRGEGRTIIFVSHSMTAIRQMCRRVFLLEAGEVREEGAAELVTSHYLADAGGKDKENGANPGDFDLSNHPARITRGASVIRRLTLYNSAGAATTEFYPNDALVAELLLDSETLIKEPRVAISIEDGTGKRVTTAATFFQDSGIFHIDGATRLRCVIPSLRLGSGRYLLSVSVASDEAGMIDGLHNAAWFEVVWRDSFGNGEAFSPIYGQVLTASKWERID